LRHTRRRWWFLQIERRSHLVFLSFQSLQDSRYIVCFLLRCRCHIKLNRVIRNLCNCHYLQLHNRCSVNRVGCHPFKGDDTCYRCYRPSFVQPRRNLLPPIRSTYLFILHRVRFCVNLLLNCWGRLLFCCQPPLGGSTMRKFNLCFRAKENSKLN
jgi:hypothetical protein